MSESPPPHDEELNSLLSGEHPIAKRYQQQRAEPPPALKAAIDSARAEAAKMPPPEQIRRPVLRRYRSQWLAVASIAGAVFLLLPIIGKRPTRSGVGDVDNQVDAPADMLRVRGGPQSPEWQDAEALRLQLLLDHPDWSARLTAAENRAWQLAARRRCSSLKPADVEPSDASAEARCLRSQGVLRQQYLRRAYLLPASEGIYGQYSNGLFGTVDISRLKNPRDAHVEIEVFDPGTGHVGQVAGTVDQDQLLLVVPQGSDKPCRVQLQLAGRELDVLAEFCEDHVGTGVQLSGNYRRLSEQLD